MQIQLFTQVDKEVIEIMEERYKCHFTITEIANEFGFSYGQINSLFYKFKLRGIKKYNRHNLSKETDHVAHSITA